MKTIQKKVDQLTLSPIFFVLVRIGENHPDDAYPVGKQWIDAYEIVSDRVMELLDTDKTLAASISKNRGHYLLVLVEEEKFEEHKGFGSHGKIRQNLQLLMSEAISHLGSPRRGSLLAEEPGRGQLFATVLLVENEDAARAYCQQAQGGEVSVAEQGGVSRALVFAQALRELLSELPASYDAKLAALAAVNDVVREQTAKTLEEAINKEAQNTQKHPQETYEDKKELAKWVNAQLRRFGLALKAPKITEPCILLAHPGNHPDIGRFQLDYADKNGRHHRTLHSVALPALELVPDDLTRVPYGRNAGHSR